MGRLILIPPTEATGFEYELVEGAYKFARVTNTTFMDNLDTIDSRMAELLAEVLLMVLGNNEISNQNIIEKLNKKNLWHSRSKIIYEYKLIAFYRAVLMGMKTDEAWDGMENYDWAIKLGLDIYDTRKIKAYLLENARVKVLRSEQGKKRVLLVGVEC